MNMLDGYIECALWSSADWSEEGIDPTENLDANYGPDDISAETLAAMLADCEAFARDNAADLEIFYRLARVDESQAGHSFWLSRNGHGAGFLDWTHPAELDGACKRLQDAARVYGEVDLYAHKGQIYC